MMNSQILHLILKIDGYAKQTQVMIKRTLVLGLGEVQRDGGGPSGTSDDLMDLYR